MTEYLFSNLFELQMGKTPSRSKLEYWDNGINPWISIADMSASGKYIEQTKESITSLGIKESGIKIIPANTVIMSFKLSIGKVAITPKPMYSNEAIIAFINKGKEKIKTDYLYYLLNQKKWDTTANKAVMGQTLNKANLSAMKLRLHTITKQEEIVAVLDKVSVLIDSYKQQLQKLDNLVKARFIEMFAKKDVMENWPEKKIMDISTDMRTGPFGSALLHDEFVDSGIFVLGIDNAVENKFSYNRMRYITEEKYQQLKRYTVNPDDVIITIMGTVGRSAVIPRNIPRAINTKHLACITLDRDQANPYFLSCAFQTHPVIRTQLQKQSKGAIMDGLNLTIIKKLSFALPPIDLQEQFVDFYNQINKSKVAVQQALDKTQQLFDSLMQEYFG